MSSAICKRSYRAAPNVTEAILETLAQIQELAFLFGQRDERKQRPAQERTHSTHGVNTLDERRPSAIIDDLLQEI